MQEEANFLLRHVPPKTNLILYFYCYGKLIIRGNDENNALFSFATNFLYVDCQKVSWVLHHVEATTIWV